MAKSVDDRGRGARMARRDEGAYCRYVTEEQRSQRGWIGREGDRLSLSRALSRARNRLRCRAAARSRSATRPSRAAQLRQTPRTRRRRRLENTRKQGSAPSSAEATQMPMRIPGCYAGAAPKLPWLVSARGRLLVGGGCDVTQDALARAVAHVARALVVAFELGFAGLQRARDGVGHVVAAVFAGRIATRHVEQERRVRNHHVPNVAGLCDRYVTLRLLQMQL